MKISLTVIAAFLITRHVILPRDTAKNVPTDHLLSEEEWRSLGVQRSHGWQHYARHRPEPHILLFRREIGYTEKYGNVPLASIPMQQQQQQYHDPTLAAPQIAAHQMLPVKKVSSR